MIFHRFSVGREPAPPSAGETVDIFHSRTAALRQHSRKYQRHIAVHRVRKAFPIPDQILPSVEKIDLSVKPEHGGRPIENITDSPVLRQIPYTAVGSTEQFSLSCHKTAPKTSHRPTKIPYRPVPRSYPQMVLRCDLPVSHFSGFPLPQLGITVGRFIQSQKFLDLIHTAFIFRCNLRHT